jgi:NAD(P)-dependent dehydrogenase (short-subunit alcohol dehydrogenase family)
MMAVSFAPDVRVNAVAPGLVLAPAGKNEQYLEERHHTNPLRAHGGEEGIAEAVHFLLRSGFITGQTIYVDGGRHLQGKMYA